MGGAPRRQAVPVKKVIRADEACCIGSEKVHAGTYTDADAPDDGIDPQQTCRDG
jgi:hypothetical protein